MGQFYVAVYTGVLLDTVVPEGVLSVGLLLGIDAGVLGTGWWLLRRAGPPPG